MSATFQLQFEDICVECDSVMGIGEWAQFARYPGSDSRVLHAHGCPRQPKTCPDCFLQHNGECP